MECLSPEPDGVDGLSVVGTDVAIPNYVHCHLQNVNKCDSLGGVLITQKGLKSRRIFVEKTGVFNMSKPNN